MTNTHLITPCPVCGMVDECPHTPVRCQHRWNYDGLPVTEETQRECEYCGRIEKARMGWDTVKP